MSDIAFDGMVFDRLAQIGDQSQRIGELEREIARLRLTDAEREAVSHALLDAEQDAELFQHGEDAERAAALRGLLERLGGLQ